MPRIAANLTMLFNEYPFLERFDRAAAAGFKAIEFQFPYEYKASDIADRLTQNGLELVLYNLPGGDWSAGDRGIAALYDRQDEFRVGVAKAIEYAAVLKPPRINLLAGKAAPTPENDLALLQNIRLAAQALSDENITLTLEPVNSHDVPDFAIPTTRAAIDLIAEMDESNIGLQYDVYHSIRMGEDPFEIIADMGNDIAHIQIADAPGRHQPGTGDIDFPKLFQAIDASGYTGWVALEYIPEGQTEDGFGLLRDLGLLG